jgi:yecA family protein
VLQSNENSHEQAVNLAPLTDAELDKLADILKRFGDKRAMNLETLDGFFAALICGPDDVPPSEYLPEIWGGNMVNEPAFQTRPILQEFISLITRHWNATCDTLQSGNVSCRCYLRMRVASLAPMIGPTASCAAWR